MMQGRIKVRAVHRSPTVLVYDTCSRILWGFMRWIGLLLLSVRGLYKMQPGGNLRMQKDFISYQMRKELQQR